MMTTENLPTRPQPVSCERTPTAGSNNRKTPSSSSHKSQSPSKAASPKCPRCDSTQTKFCYYNNYSLTQPRYFCKSCRRYWTKGGALRNVPVGGGCRKNKKLKSSSSSSTSSTPTLLSTFHFPMDFGDMTSDIGSLKFFHASTSTSTPPAVDFHLGGGLTNFSSIQSTPIAPLTPAALCPQISSFAGISTNRCSYGLDLTAGLEGRNSCPTSFMGLSNSPISSTGLKPNSGGYGIPSISDMGTSNLMTSIESLSSINQELHWKLQQQRLAMLYGQGQTEEENKEYEGSLGNNNHQQMEKLQPILFQNLEISKCNDGRHQAMGGVIGGSTAARKEENTSRGAVTEWFFDNVPHISSSVMGGVITNGANTPSSNNGGGNNNNDMNEQQEDDERE